MLHTYATALMHVLLHCGHQSVQVGVPFRTKKRGARDRDAPENLEEEAAHSFRYVCPLYSMAAVVSMHAWLAVFAAMPLQLALHTGEQHWEMCHVCCTHTQPSASPA